MENIRNMHSKKLLLNVFENVHFSSNNRNCGWMAAVSNI